LYPTTL
jgi:hypothetical protein